MEVETTAKVRLVTTKGNIDVELYAREIPGACRVFLENCLGDKYSGLNFDRLMADLVEVTPKSLVTQIRRESHLRVKFSARGNVGLLNIDGSHMACPDGFFLTTKPLPELNGHYVVIGKVVGDLIYNVVKIHDAEKQDDGVTPVYPVSITKVEVLQPFFDDLAAPKPVQETRKRKKPRTAVKLSYDDEDDGQDEKFVMKSAHELLGKKEKKLNETSNEEDKQKENGESRDTKTGTEEPAPKQIEPAADVEKVNAEPEPLQSEKVLERASGSEPDLPQSKKLETSEPQTGEPHRTSNELAALPVSGEEQVLDKSQEQAEDENDENDKNDKNEEDEEGEEDEEEEEDEDDDEEPTRDPSIDPHNPILDMWKDTVDFHTLQHHHYRCS